MVNLKNYNGTLDLTGHRLQSSLHKSIQVAVQARGSVLLRAFPVATLPAAISVCAIYVRKSPEMSWFAAAIDHPLAIQVFGIMFAFLITSRVARSLLRWWEGMTCVCNMQNVWLDTCILIISYVKRELDTLHAQLRRPDLNDDTREWVREKIKKVTLFGHTILHWFFLLNAIALATLKSGESKVLRSIACKHPNFDFLSDEIPSPKVSNGRRSSFTKVTTDGLDKMLYVGELTNQEEKELYSVEEKTVLVVQWIYEALLQADQEQIVPIPPPVQSSIQRQVSVGLHSYFDSYRIAVVPYPFPLAQINSFLMVVFLFLMPIVVEKFTQALFLTPLLSFIIALCYWGLNKAAQELENPFGEDPNDLPLKDFCDTYIDSLMESSIACLKNVGNPLHKSVHVYSDICMKGIIPSKAPADVKEPTSPTSPASPSTTKPKSLPAPTVVSSSGHGPASAMPTNFLQKQLRQRAHSADPRTRAASPPSLASWSQVKGQVHSLEQQRQQPFHYNFHMDGDGPAPGQILIPISVMPHSDPAPAEFSNAELGLTSLNMASPHHPQALSPTASNMSYGNGRLMSPTATVGQLNPLNMPMSPSAAVGQLSPMNMPQQELMYRRSPFYQPALTGEAYPKGCPRQNRFSNGYHNAHAMDIEELR